MGARLDRRFEQKRNEMIQDFLSRWFLFGGLPMSDTYKRTMWGTDTDLSLTRAAYHLTMRKGLNETRANNQLIMCGHEWLLRQWFLRPIKRQDIELLMEWYRESSEVSAFPWGMFQHLLDSTKGDEITLPIDIWGFPGGQTFLGGVPALTFENGPGGLISYLEPQMCRYFGPCIRATKGRLMYEVSYNGHAEFGYRSSESESAAVAKMLAIFVGNGGKQVFTSCDLVQFMFPKMFKDVGTLGHEFMSAAQSFSKSLDEAELEQMMLFASRNERAALLGDLIDAETVGIRNVEKVLRAFPEKRGIGGRVDSGDIVTQCALYDNTIRRIDPKGRWVIYEDEVNPDKVREVERGFVRQTRRAPEKIFPGAGGYYDNKVHRDTVSAAFKRSQTGENPNIKFSNSPGKESIPGTVRVYDQDDTLVVADVTEVIDGIPLYVKLVDQGRIVNTEDMDFFAQADRANRTWRRYKRVELSPLIAEWKEKFLAMRQEAQERARSQS